MIAVENAKETDSRMITEFFTNYKSNLNLHPDKLETNFSNLIMHIKEVRRCLSDEDQIKNRDLDPDHSSFMLEQLTLRIYPLFKLIDMLWKNKPIN